MALKRASTARPFTWTEQVCLLQKRATDFKQTPPAVNHDCRATSANTLASTLQSLPYKTEFLLSLSLTDHSDIIGAWQQSGNTHTQMNMSNHVCAHTLTQAYM